MLFPDAGDFVGFVANIASRRLLAPQERRSNADEVPI
jgi:hypothetical protein